MPTPEDLDRRQRRRAWWLRVARRGMSQNGVAESIGLSKRSGSTIGDWERGTSEPSLRQLEQLSTLYGVPLSLFTDPPPTDDERLDEIVRLAGSAERADWEREGELPRATEDGQPYEPGRRSA